MSSKSIVMLIALFVASLVLFNSVYIINEFERAVMLRLGKVENPDIATGFHFKIPLIDEVRKFDGRVLTIDRQPERFLTSEKKSLLVDSFAKWRIIDVSTYYTATNGESSSAERLISQRINEGLRNQFAQRELSEVVSGERDQLMVDLIDDLNSYSHTSLGVEVVDVRVKRIDLPVEVRQPVFNRMEAERQQEAAAIRASGTKQATIITSDADKQVVVIEAEAFRKAELLRGQGDATAAEIYAQAFNKNPEFYGFVRSLNAYRETFQGKQDILLVDPESDFFKYLKNADGSR